MITELIHFALALFFTFIALATMHGKHRANIDSQVIRLEHRIQQLEEENLELISNQLKIQVLMGQKL